MEDLHTDFISQPCEPKFSLYPLPCTTHQNLCVQDLLLSPDCSQALEQITRRRRREQYPGQFQEPTYHYLNVLCSFYFLAFVVFTQHCTKTFTSSGREQEYQMFFHLTRRRSRIQPRSTPLHIMIMIMTHHMRPNK